MSVLLLVTLALGSVPAAGPRVTATAKQVDKLTLDGKPDEAIEKGRTAVTAHPDDNDLRLALARALTAKGRHASRVVDVPVSSKDVAAGQLAVPGDQLDRARVQVDYDKALFEEAMGHLDVAIKRAPRREDLRVLQCFLLTDAGYIDRAKAAITSALASLTKTPTLATKLASYGGERAKRNDPAGGEKLLAPVVAAFPKDPSVLVDYGNVLTRLGKKQEAFAALDRATALAPNETRYARIKAISAMLLRDFARARSAFDTAFRLGQGGPDKLASLAAAYGVDPKASAGLAREVSENGATFDATVTELATQFAAASKSGPASPDAMKLAKTLTDAQQYALSIPVLDRAIKAAPTKTEARSLLKSAYAGLGCPALAP